MRTARIAQKGWRRNALFAATAALAAWLISPMFFAQHVEGYAANLQAIAHMLNRGEFLSGDPMYPAVTEFHYYSRAALIGMLQITDRLFGSAGDWGFRILVILSFAILAGASIFIASRLGSVRPWAAGLALLLAPGVSEVAFHLNDNLPAAALAVTGLAVVVLRDSRLTYAISGALAAASVLCRLDSILLAPAVAAYAWVQHPQWRSLAVRALSALAGFTAVLLAAAFILKATPADAFLVARHFFPGSAYLTTAIMLFLFIGAPGTLLLAVGLVGELRRESLTPNRIGRFVLLYVHPALILAAALRLSTETRYIYPLLTPYIALHAGRGLEMLVFGIHGRYRRASLAALIALILFVVLPPPLIAVRDGPRSPVGRLWMPAFWWRWELTMANSLERVDALVAHAEKTPRLLLLGSHFNEDFFLKQRFLSAGYQIDPATAVFPACEGFIVYSKGPSIVAHLRTERQYWQVRTSKTRFRALLMDRSLSCPALRSFDHAFLVLWGDDKRVASFADTIDPGLMDMMLPRLRPIEALSASFTPESLFRWPFWHSQPAEPGVPRHQMQGTLRTYALSQRDLEAIALAARAYLGSPVKPNALNDDGPVTLEQFRAAYSPRCKNLQGSSWDDLPLCLR